MAKHHTVALQHIQNNQWHQAHELIQQNHDPLSSLIHGYLHWQEGDLSNADYWYHRAGQIRPTSSLQHEFVRITQLINDDN